MIVPDLPKLITRYQECMQPEDFRFGEGIAGWTITCEYDDNPHSENGGGPIWGCMCSPSVLAAEGIRVKLQPEDIEAKRAHIVCRTPKTPDDIIELERTVVHELGHVLHAKLNLPRDLEEEVMHSLDHFFSKLSPEQGAILARSFQNPMARAYRAKETAMPDPIEETKDKPDKEAPKMAEGAPRDVAAITHDIVKAVLAGQPTEDLAKELVLAQALAGAGNGPASAPAPAVMGMPQQEAYARAKRDADRAAATAFVKVAPGLEAKQRAWLAMKCDTVKDVEDALDAMFRAQAPITLPEHPAKGKDAPVARNVGGLPANDASAMARQMGAKSNAPAMPKIMANGRFTLGNATPTQLREAIARGNDPRNHFPATMGDN